jgi:hypothetical protein
VGFVAVENLVAADLGVDEFELNGWRGESRYWKC